MCTPNGASKAAKECDAAAVGSLDMLLLTYAHCSTTLEDRDNKADVTSSPGASNPTPTSRSVELSCNGSYCTGAESSPEQAARPAASLDRPCSVHGDEHVTAGTCISDRVQPPCKAHDLTADRKQEHQRLNFDGQLRAERWQQEPRSTPGKRDALHAVSRPIAKRRTLGTLSITEAAEGPMGHALASHMAASPDRPTQAWRGHISSPCVSAVGAQVQVAPVQPSLDRYYSRCGHTNGIGQRRGAASEPAVKRAAPASKPPCGWVKPQAHLAHQKPATYSTPHASLLTHVPLASQVHAKQHLALQQALVAAAGAPQSADSSTSRMLGRQTCAAQFDQADDCASPCVRLSTELLKQQAASHALDQSGGLVKQGTGPSEATRLSAWNEAQNGSPSWSLNAQCSMVSSAAHSPSRSQ
jgi:hypothetical protein